MEQELARFTELAREDEPHFRVVVREHGGGGASLELYRPDGERAFERSIRSDDCASLAEALSPRQLARLSDDELEDIEEMLSV